MLNLKEYKRLEIENRFRPLIVHLVENYGLTKDECITHLLDYRSVCRTENFSDYLMRVCLTKKGYCFEES